MEKRIRKFTQLNECIIASENQIKRTAIGDESFPWFKPASILHASFGWFSSFLCCPIPLGCISCRSTRWLLTKHWQRSPEFCRRMNWFFHAILHDFQFAIRWPVFIAHPFVLRQSFRVYIIRKWIQSILSLTLPFLVLTRWKSEHNPFEITSTLFRVTGLPVW